MARSLLICAAERTTNIRHEEHLSRQTFVEDPAFPGMQQWPHEFSFNDEIYQMKFFSRNKVRVLMRLDPCRVDYANPRVHQNGPDFTVTWAEMYGKRRESTTLHSGTLKRIGDDPRQRDVLLLVPIKWGMGLENADLTPLHLLAATAKDACKPWR